MGVDLSDDRGLICGFRLSPKGAAEPIDASALKPLQSPPEHPVWLHFNYNDGRARDWIANCAWLGEESREALLSTDHNIRFETVGQGVCIVLGEAYADDYESLGVYSIYFDQHVMVSTRRHQLTALGLLRNDLVAGVVVTDTIALFLRVLDHMAATFAKAVLEFATLVDEAEEHVFSGRFREVNALGQLRQLMARHRRQRSGNRQALADMLEHLPPWWSKAATVELRHAVGRLTALAQDLELAADRARLLSEEIDSRLTAATNRNLYFVSIVAAVFLPITLISGIFGMNVGGLPWTETPRGFIWAMLCMLAAVLIALWALRRKRMF